MSRLQGLPLILLGVWLIADRRNPSRVWVRNVLSPVNSETGMILRVVIGMMLIAAGASMIARSGSL
jgi:hypothetical protein